jgi:predicted nuclease of predicted toxin-antitoxin system
MKILIDDTLPPLIAARLRGAGHDVRVVHNVASLENQIARSIGTAMRERRLFITAVADATFFKNADHAGVLIIRLRRPNREKLEQAVARGMQQVPESEWPGMTVEIREGAIKSWQRVPCVDLAA